MNEKTTGKSVYPKIIDGYGTDFLKNPIRGY